MQCMPLTLVHSFALSFSLSRCVRRVKRSNLHFHSRIPARIQRIYYIVVDFRRLYTLANFCLLLRLPLYVYVCVCVLFHYFLRLLLTLFPIFAIRNLPDCNLTIVYVYSFIHIHLFVHSFIRFISFDLLSLSTYEIITNRLNFVIVWSVCNKLRLSVSDYVCVCVCFRSFLGSTFINILMICDAIRL